MTQINEVLRVLNPWWSHKVIKIEDIINREIESEIQELLKLRHIKDILGVRRSGKTTLLFLIVDNLIRKGVDPKKIFFLTFDEINLSTSNFEEIEKEIFQLNPDPDYLFLDECQEKRDLEKWVKKLYDLKKFKQIFVSGSNTSLLSNDVGKLLTGRHITLVNFPFSFKEFLDANIWESFEKDYLLSEKNRIIHYLTKYLKNGGFPEVVRLDEISVNKILSNVYNDIISRDISMRYVISRDKIDKLSKYLFTNIAKEYSYNKLAKAVGMDIETVERYLKYLEEAFLFFSVALFSYKLKVQFRQNKKIYSIDNGLRNSASFRFSQDIGKLCENAVFLELKRRNKEVYYWKDAKGEVDFLIKEGIEIVELIQVCHDLSDEKIKKREIDSLIRGAKQFKLKQGKIITNDLLLTEKTNNVKIEFIPLWIWLLDVNIIAISSQ